MKRGRLSQGEFLSAVGMHATINYLGLDCGSEFPVSRPVTPLERMAGTTGLEPATSAVTGQRSNQLNYVPSCFSYG